MKKFLFSVMLACIFATIFNVVAFAATDEPLDEIQDYTISVDTLPDGNAKIVYHFDWKVLDSETEGPLEYLFVGIPNSHADNIEALSDNIKSIEYTSSSDDGDGHFLRIDFYRGYYKDEEFTFDFSIEQGYLYILKDDGTVTFGFTPGWFPEIAINKLTVYWNGNYTISSNCDYVDDNNRLVWETSLPSGESEQLSISVQYPQNKFESLDEDKQATNADDLENFMALILVIVVVAMFLVFVLSIVSDGYGGGGGYHGGGVFISSCAHSSCAHSSCACACACAGGGRAGCSAKNIRGADVESVNKAIKNCKANLKIR